MERYKSLTKYLEETFGYKVGKLCIDAGFSCPNRKNSKGCLFCTDRGGGEFCSLPGNSITQQILGQKAIVNKKWAIKGYIAYFQSFTNTYAPLEVLKKKYDEALSQENIIGLAIATRPDCIDQNTLELLKEYNKKTFLWIELGFQTANEENAEFINRGYENAVYEKCTELLNANNIKHVVHLIAGLPNEDKKDFMQSVQYVSRMGIWGIKLHSLFVQSNSPIYELYKSGLLKILSLDEYVDYVCDAIEMLPKDCVIHRLTGDGDRTLLVEPLWTKHKLKVLSSIKNELEKRNTYQGVFNGGRLSSNISFASKKG